jgi:ligand-binding sensor protein
MKITDLMTQDQWDDYVRETHHRFAISFAVSDPVGARVSREINWCNRLCPVVKKNAASLSAICAVAARSFSESARQSRQPEIGGCDLGLIKFAVPIFVEDEFIGTAGGCGFLPEKGEVEDFLLQKTTGMDDAQIADLTNAITRMSDVRIRQMADHVHANIAQIVGRYQDKKR